MREESVALAETADRLGTGPTAQRRKYVVLAVLFAAFTYNFLDRQVLSVALQAIKIDLHMSDTQLGILTGVAFSIFYSIVGIPIARWADRGNRSAIISLCLALLSATVALSSAAGSFVQLMLVRIGVGIGEAGIVPPAHSLVASYFERNERLRAMSILLLGGADQHRDRLSVGRMDHAVLRLATGFPQHCRTGFVTGHGHKTPGA